ncbi:beta-lactamase family protein [Streptomyces sp. PanSC19]|nr:beta-lactamase family protein [Streptomyces sp. PanSC19]
MCLDPHPVHSAPGVRVQARNAEAPLKGAVPCAHPSRPSGTIAHTEVGGGNAQHGRGPHGRGAPPSRARARTGGKEPPSRTPRTGGGGGGARAGSGTPEAGPHRPADVRQSDQSKGARPTPLPKLRSMIRRPHLPTWALLGALLGASSTAWSWPAEAHRAPALCTSSREPTLAARLSRDIAAALKGREGTVSVAVHDPVRGLRCRLADTLAYDSASIAKVLIMQAVLGRAEELGRAPTRLEARRLKAMITRSDNTAATELWEGLSRARLNRVLREAGARDTVLGHGNYWGLTRTTARDQLALLAAVSRRDEALSLMGQVVHAQAWGVTAGAPRTVKVHLKNGWLPRATHAWRVHSVGIVRPAAPPPDPGTGPSAGKGTATGTGAGANTGTGAGAGTDTGTDTAPTNPAVDYRIVLLSHGNPTMRYGVRTLEGIALAVHRRLSGGTAARGFTPPEKISEIPDGSAPAEAPGQGDPGAPAPALAPAPTPARPESFGPAAIRGAAPPSRTARAPRRAPRRRRSRPWG